MLEMHHFKVRSFSSLPARAICRFRRQFFALDGSLLSPPALQDTIGHSRVKEQVKMVAHPSAWVSWYEHGYLLTFTAQSVFAGRSLRVKRESAYQLVLPFAKSCFFRRFEWFVLGLY